MSSPGVITIDAAYLLASDIITGLAAALATQSLGGTVDRVTLAPGQLLAWDNCSCGTLQLAQYVTYPSRHFPQDFSEQRVGTCDQSYTVAQFVVGMVRCVPTPDEDGNAPTEVDLTVAAHIDWQDRQIIRNFLACYLAAVYEKPPTPTLRVGEWILGQTVGVGPFGGCAGSETRFKVAWWSDCQCG